MKRAWSEPRDIRNTATRLSERALEYQKYASNATYTVNLLHSALRAGHYNIIDGPSNGNELLLFFEDVLTMDNPDGSVVLERGDTVFMDNCGFHHGHFTEGMLRDMFDEYGVRLLFQPAYCPNLNTCELCFNQLKSFLRRFNLFAQQETRIAVAEGISSITQQNCVAYFKCWGYLWLWELVILSRRSVTPRDLSNTGSPAGFPKTRAKKWGGMLRIKSAMLSLCLCECGPHSPIATW